MGKMQTSTETPVTAIAVEGLAEKKKAEAALNRQELLKAKMVTLEIALQLPPIRDVTRALIAEENKPEWFEWRLVLWTGKTIALGKASDVLSFRKFQAAVLDATGKVVNPKEGKCWEVHTQYLADILFALMEDKEAIQERPDDADGS